MLNIAVMATRGRMGRIISEIISSDTSDEICLSAAIQRIDNDSANSDQRSYPIVKSIADAEFDLLIDFSTVTTSLENLNYCQKNNKMMVIGTTGFDADQLSEIKQASNKIPVVLSANMSIGVNLCFSLIKKITQVIGSDTDIEINETHHRDKIDAPSGTALQMGEIIANTRGHKLEECAVYSRRGISKIRGRNTIGFTSIRAGDVVGEHTVLFASENERIELTHKASSRLAFANGSLYAAKWLANQQNGLYNMQDVLGLGDI